MEKNGCLIEDVDGKVIADIRSADELVGSINLFPGWVIVELLHMSDQTRGGVVLPSDKAKQQHNLMLFRVVVVGDEKEVDPGKKRPIRFSVGDIVVLKPSLAQAILATKQEFGVVSDVDVIGTMTLKKIGENE